MAELLEDGAAMHVCKSYFDIDAATDRLAISQSLIDVHHLSQVKFTVEPEACTV